MIITQQQFNAAMIEVNNAFDVITKRLDALEAAPKKPEPKKAAK